MPGGYKIKHVKKPNRYVIIDEEQKKNKDDQALIYVYIGGGEGVLVIKQLHCTTVSAIDNYLIRRADIVLLGYVIQIMWPLSFFPQLK